VSRDFFHQPPLPTIWDTIRADDLETRSGECFADEIAIDFPAVGHLAERVRDAFLGAAATPDMLTTEVLLSRREAVCGTVVPLDVPMRGTCVSCGGRGETWAEPCSPCRGSGETLLFHAVHLRVPPGVTDGARFRFRVRAPHASTVRIEVRVAVRRTAA